MTFQITGAVGLLAVVLTAVLAPKIYRHFTWLNFCITWLIYCISYTCALTLSNAYGYDSMKIGLVLLAFGIGEHAPQI